jgi:adenylate cyclase
VSRELGVKYVLEGSVRKVGNRVRITAQLINGTTGHHVWAERYDRNLEDIFAIQDEVTLKILKELQVKLTSGEQVRLYYKGTENIDAYLRMNQARFCFYHNDRESNIVARQICEEVIALDPKWELPYGVIGWTHWMDARMGWSDSPEESVAKAFQYAEESISLNESSAAHGLLSWLYLITGMHEKALLEGERGIALAPNSADAHAHYAFALAFAGGPEKAMSCIEYALRLNPFPPSWYFIVLGVAYRVLGRYVEAIASCKKAISVEPSNLIAHIVLTTAYALDGREKEAQAEAEEVLRIDPKFSVERYAKSLAFMNQAYRDISIDALRRAGLK